MRIFLLLLMLFPVLELFVFFKVSGVIGFFLALLLIIIGSLLGVLVLRVSGMAAAIRARERLNNGEIPAQTMLENLIMSLAGGLLILPGFISDVLGLFMLLPFTRKLLSVKIYKRAEEVATQHSELADGLQSRGGRSQSKPLGGESYVIEGEFEHLDIK